jgi:hypothetical protein
MTTIRKSVESTMWGMQKPGLSSLENSLVRERFLGERGLEKRGEVVCVVQSSPSLSSGVVK